MHILSALLIYKCRQIAKCMSSVSRLSAHTDVPIHLEKKVPINKPLLLLNLFFLQEAHTWHQAGNYTHPV